MGAAYFNHYYYTRGPIAYRYAVPVNAGRFIIINITEGGQLVHIRTATGYKATFDIATYKWSFEHR